MSKVLDVIMQRRSDRHFAKRPLEPEVVDALFEAFRWAPSSNNRQPWRIVVARGAQASAAFDAALSEGNRAWATVAPLKLVIVGATEEQPDRNGLQSFMLDLGFAMENMMIQGYAMGLTIHAMAGWDAAKITAGFALPEKFRPVALMAAGHRGRVEDLPEEVAAKDRKPRTRRPVEEIVHWDTFGGARG